MLCEGGEAIVLNSGLDLTDQAFEWQKDGTVVDTTSEALTVTAAGVYQLIINTNDCPLISKETMHFLGLPWNPWISMESIDFH